MSTVYSMQRALNQQDKPTLSTSLTSQVTSPSKCFRVTLRMSRAPYAGGFLCTTNIRSTAEDWWNMNLKKFGMNNHSLIEVPSLQLTFSKNRIDNLPKFKSSTYRTEVQAVPAHMNLSGSNAYRCSEPHHHDHSIMSEHNCLFKLCSQFHAIKTHLYGYCWNCKLLSNHTYLDFPTCDILSSKCLANCHLPHRFMDHSFFFPPLCFTRIRNDFQLWHSTVLSQRTQ